MVHSKDYGSASRLAGCGPFATVLKSYEENAIMPCHAMPCREQAASCFALWGERDDAGARASGNRYSVFGLRLSERLDVSKSVARSIFKNK